MAKTNIYVRGTVFPDLPDSSEERMDDTVTRDAELTNVRDEIEAWALTQGHTLDLTTVRMARRKVGAKWVADWTLEVATLNGLTYPVEEDLDAIVTKMLSFMTESNVELDGIEVESVSDTVTA